jgi:transposase InsO family protein
MQSFQMHGKVTCQMDIKRRNRLPIAYKITDAQAKFATTYVSEHQTVSNKELVEAMKEKFPRIDITPQHLGSVVRDNNLTRKRTRHGHFPETRYRQPVSKSVELKKFYDVTDAHPINKIISIDETSLAPFMFHAYSRCNIGSRCIQTTSNNKVFTKHTFIAAITNKETLGWKLYDEGGSNTERFGEFLKSLITTHKLKGYLFLMDNAGAHKNETIRSLVTESGNKIQYTVPYNPQTNAIENWFSQFKHYMATAKVRSVADIRADVLTVLKKIKVHHYKHYFEYAYRRGEYQQDASRKDSTRTRAPKVYQK